MGHDRGPSYNTLVWIKHRQRKENENELLRLALS